MRTQLKRAASCGLVVLALALAGCSEDPERPSEPETTSSETSTTSATPTPTASSGPNGVVPIPVPDPRASEQTEEGAIAFNVHWVMTLDFSYATLDVEPLRAASSPECNFCNYIVDFLGPRRDQGYVYQGGRFTVTGSLVLAFDGTSATVTTIFSVTELVVTDPQGNRDPDSEAAHAAFQFQNQLTWTDQGWLVLDAKGGDV